MPGMDLKDALAKANNFINNDVRKPLGIPNLNNEPEPQDRKSIIGRYNNINKKLVLITYSISLRRRKTR